MMKDMKVLIFCIYFQSGKVFVTNGMLEPVNAKHGHFW